MLEVERALSLDACLALVQAGGAEGESFLALASALGADLARQLSRLGADEPRLFVREEEVEVLERLPGGLDVCGKKGWGGQLGSRVGEGSEGVGLQKT